MNKFELHTFGLPSFGISDFRLTSFGGDGDGGRKAAFHNPLVDAWFMSGYSNSDKPKEIVGVRGNAIELNNFLYAKNSGFGKYAEDFMSYNAYRDRATFIRSHAHIHITETFNFNNFIETALSDATSEFSVKISGIGDVGLSYIYYNSDVVKIELGLQNGINKLPKSFKGNTGFKASLKLGKCDITITQIPENEGSLCFDGVDDYGICVGLPLLEDYTVICRRVIGDKVGEQFVASKSASPKDGAFFFEHIKPDVIGTYSFTIRNVVTNYKNDGISYQTKNSYNGAPISFGNAVDCDTLLLGRPRLSEGHYFIGSIYYFALYNKSLSPKEIEEEKIKLEQKWKSKLK